MGGVLRGTVLHGAASGARQLSNHAFEVRDGGQGGDVVVIRWALMEVAGQGRQIPWPARGRATPRRANHP